MITATWISAMAAVISIPISIWAIVSAKNNTKRIKKVEQNIGRIHMEGNRVNGSGTILHMGDKK